MVPGFTFCLCLFCAGSGEFALCAIFPTFAYGTLCVCENETNIYGVFLTIACVNVSRHLLQPTPSRCASDSPLVYPISPFVESNGVCKISELIVGVAHLPLNWSGTAVSGPVSLDVDAILPCF